MDGDLILGSNPVISDDRLYTYAHAHNALEPNGKLLLFCGLSASAVDAHALPGTRRMIDFALRWGYSMLCVVNLFAYRCAEPHMLRLVKDPVGPENDYWLNTLADRADMRIAAWGPSGTLFGRAKSAIPLLGELHCLGMTQDGSPRTPLSVRATVHPVPFTSSGTQ